MRSNWWPIIIVLSAIGTGFAMFGNLESPARALLTLWFLLVCPGMAFVPLLKIERRLIALTIAVSLSVAIDTTVALTMLYAGEWSAAWGVISVIAIGVCGALLQVVANYRQAMG